MRSRRNGWIAALVWACLAAGCRTTELPEPALIPTRDAQQQQFQAQKFDPYPQNDIGPSVSGGRPRDYQTPIAEPSRARWDPRTWVNRFSGR